METDRRTVNEKRSDDFTNFKVDQYKQFNDKEISDIKEVLKSHANHLQIANQEMGEIKKSTSALQGDVAWIKGLLEKTDGRMWWILSTVIGGTLLSIAVQVFK